jgi:phosphoribulokinase
VCDREGKRTLNLGLLSGRVSGTGVGGASGGTSGGGGTTTGTDVQEQVLNILALKSLEVVSETKFHTILQSRMRTLAKRVVQIGSTSSIFAALIRDWSLSACEY